MAYLLEAYLDPESDAKVRHLWRVLNERGMGDSNLRNDSTPHLTLTTCATLDEAAAQAALALVARRAPIPLSLRGLAIFPGERATLYLPAVPSVALLDLQRACAEVAGDAVEGRWTPHVSLARRLPSVALPGAVGVLHDQDLTIDATIDRIGLLRDRPIVRLGEWELGREEVGDKGQEG